MNVLQISLIQDFKVQNNSIIYSDSRGFILTERDEELVMEEGN